VDSVSLAVAHGVDVLPVHVPPAKPDRFLPADRLALPRREGADLRQHYFANHRWFFTLGAILPPAGAVDTLLKGTEHFRAQGPLYVVFLAVVLILMVIAARTRRAGFHAFFAVFFLVYLIAFISVNLRVLA
jgi:hypothetical protein